MTVRDALAWGAKQLKNIDASTLDASVLLCAALGKPKEFLYTYPEKKLTVAQTVKYKKFIARRAKHEPVAYILGKKEFYGFEFAVNKNVLIPRPDTETLISTVLSTIGLAMSNSYPHIIDAGTGSGAIAVTLKKLLPKAQVFASDISSTALTLAKKNARRLGVNITFKKGNLLSPFKSLLLDLRCPIVITANLPYLSRAEWQKTAPEVKKYEPYDALVGGKHGWEVYEKLFQEIAGSYPSLWKRPPARFDNKRSLFCRLGEEAGRDLLLNPPQSSFSEGGRIFVFIEIGHNQKSAIASRAKKILHPQKIEFFKDLAGKWRVAKIVVSSK